jgi:orotate phosphoribosyltransferase
MSNLINKLKSIDAILSGHFILSSGLHSDTYIQCAKALQYPELAMELGKALADKLKELTDITKVDYIVAPAMGGLIIGYEVARNLGIKSIFLERVDGAFTLRRGFTLNKGDKVIIIEDVVTTGKSSIETAECIKSYGAEVMCEGAIINRSGQDNPLGDISLVTLERIEVATFDSNSVPAHLKDIPAVKPGSRFLKKA